MSRSSARKRKAADSEPEAQAPAPAAAAKRGRGRVARPKPGQLAESAEAPDEGLRIEQELRSFWEERDTPLLFCWLLDFPDTPISMLDAANREKLLTLLVTTRAARPPKTKAQQQLVACWRRIAKPAKDDPVPGQFAPSPPVATGAVGQDQATRAKAPAPSSALIPSQSVSAFAVSDGHDEEEDDGGDYFSADPQLAAPSPSRPIATQARGLTASAAAHPGSPRCLNSRPRRRTAVVVRRMRPSWRHSGRRRCDEQGSRADAREQASVRRQLWILGRQCSFRYA